MTLPPIGTATFQRRIGRHDVRVDDDDILTLSIDGDLRADEMREILREHDAKLNRDGDLYVVSDLRRLGSVEPGARHELGARSRTMPGYCVAYMVSGFKMKLLLEFIIKAVNVRLEGKVIFRFFDTAESAREWLRSMQQQRGRR